MEKYEMRIITNNNQIYILNEYVCITQLHELYTVYYMHKYTLYVHIIYITLHNYIYIIHILERPVASLSVGQNPCWKLYQTS